MSQELPGLQAAYERLLDLVIKCEAERDWWRTFALRLAFLHLMWVIVFLVIGLG